MVTKEELSEIIKGCRGGDEQSYYKLVEIYSKRCFGYFYRASGNRAVAEDLLSELFIKLVTKIGTFKGGSFDGWIFSVSNNIFRDYLRNKLRQKKFFDKQEEFAKEDDRPASLKNDEGFDELQVELDKLDADSKEVLMLRYYSGLGFKEISQMRKEPIGTTLSRAHRAIKKIRESMEE